MVTINRVVCPTCKETFIKTTANEDFCTLICEEYADDPENLPPLVKVKTGRSRILPTFKLRYIPGFAKLRFAVLSRDKFRCYYCGATPKKGARLHVDHVVPWSKGGDTTMENLVTACMLCNLGKTDRKIK